MLLPTLAQRRTAPSPPMIGNDCLSLRVSPDQMPSVGNCPAGRGHTGRAATRPVGVGMHVQDVNRILTIELPDESRPPLQVSPDSLEELPRSGRGTRHKSAALNDRVLSVTGMMQKNSDSIVCFKLLFLNNFEIMLYFHR